MSQVRFVKLPKSGVVIDLDNLAGIGQADINLYVALPKVGNAGLQFDGDDKDALYAWLESYGLFEAVPALPVEQQVQTKGIVAAG